VIFRVCVGNKWVENEQKIKKWGLQRGAQPNFKRVNATRCMQLGCFPPAFIGSSPRIDF